MGPGGLLEVSRSSPGGSWSPRGDLQTAWSAPGARPPKFSNAKIWLESALGAAKSQTNLAWIGSWTARGHRGDRFQVDWRPNTLPK